MKDEAELQSTIALLGELPEIDPPPAALAAWRQVPAFAKVRRRPFPAWAKTGGAAVAAILVLGLLGQAVTPGPQAGPPLAATLSRHGPLMAQMAVAPAAPGAAPMFKTFKAATVPIAGREIAQSASLSLNVAQVQRAFGQAQAIASSVGGYVSDSSFSRDPSGDTANLTLMVPAPTLGASLRKLSALGTVTSESQSGNDLTNQYVDTQTQLTDLQAEAVRYRDFLAQAKNISDMLKIEAQLAQVTDQINTLTAQMKNMTQQVTLASINLNLTVPAGVPASLPGGNLFQSLVNALTGSVDYILGLGRAVLVGLAWAIPFLALGALAYGGYRLVVKLREGR